MTQTELLKAALKERGVTQRAVAFWPCIDPDIPSHPYCRKCLDKAKAELLRSTLDDVYKQIDRKKGGKK